MGKINQMYNFIYILQINPEAWIPVCVTFNHLMLCIYFFAKDYSHYFNKLSSLE